MTKHMRVVRSTSEYREWRRSALRSTEASGASVPTLGFVPTMGALHEGHGDLIRRAAEKNDLCVVSIFVNPTQFNNTEDLAHYPRTENEDLELCRQWGADVVFIPNVSDIYADNFTFEIHEKEISQLLCGPFRPGHFTGMLTVVLKLFNIVAPLRAYFGEKDFQQLKLVEGMVAAFCLPIEIVPCPTVRENDGLAMSSRNRRLTVDQRERAAGIPKILRNFSSPGAARAELESLGFQVDYVEDLWNRRFVAAYLGKVRLIDNIEL